MDVVYYKFKSDKGDFRSLPIVGPFISVYDFKSEIFASNYYSSGKEPKDGSFLITDAKTDELFADDSLIPACSFIVIRRVPAFPRLPIVIGDERLPKIQNPSPSPLKEDESFDFGPDILATSTVIQSDTHCSKEDKINVGFKFLSEKRFVKGSFRKRQIQTLPPRGYVCHRCNVAGHYIQHCPTNGDPSFDFQTWISGSNSSGITHASAPTSTSRSHSSGGLQIAPELYCPLCKIVMKDAAMTKCCFASFCDKCIRDRVVSCSVCVCQRKIGVDDIVPNMTLRQIINGILNVNQSGTAECKTKIAKTEIEQKKVDLDEAAELTNKEDKDLGWGQWEKIPSIEQ